MACLKGLDVISATDTEEISRDEYVSTEAQETLAAGGILKKMGENAVSKLNRNRYNSD